MPLTLWVVEYCLIGIINFNLINRIGTFAFDYIMFLVVNIFFFILGFSFNIILIADFVWPWIYILISFGFSAIMWSYAWNFIY